MPIVIFAGNTQYVTLDESASISDEQDFVFGFLADESISVIDGTLWSLWKPFRISEAAMMTENLVVSFGFLMSDTVQMADALTPTIGTMIHEIFTVGTGLILKMDGSVVLSESIDITDDFGLSWRQLIVETVNASDSHSLILGTLLSESLEADSIMKSAAAYSALCAESAELSERLIAAAIITELITESLSLSDQPFAAILFSVLISEASTFQDILNDLGEYNVTIDESVSAEVALSLSKFISAIIDEGLQAGLSFHLPDGTVWETWALNSTGHHVSVYSGHGFNSYAIFASVPYAAGASGIYRLTEDSDDGQPIRTGVILSDTLLGNSEKKRIRKASFGITGHRPALKVEVDGEEIVYKIDRMESHPSKRQGGNRWIIKVVDFDTLDFIEFIPLVLVK